MAAPRNTSTLPPAGAGETPASNSATAAVRERIKGFIAKSPAAGSMDAWNAEQFDAIPLSGLRLTFIGGGRALCSYRIHASVADEKGNWHPGAIATVIDDIGGAAIMSVVGEIKVSVDFSISFFSRAKIGVCLSLPSHFSVVRLFELGIWIFEEDEVEIEANIVEDKGRLTAVVVELRHKEKGRLTPLI